ncbi:MAG: HAD-IIB family hydrolase [Psychromonas sp.]
MNKKTLIFTDLDGTLLDHYTYQSDDAKETIVTLKQSDIAIIANSSKTLPEILAIRQQLNLPDPFIIENGAAVYIPVNYFNRQPTDTKLQGEFWVKEFTQQKEHWLSLLNQQAQRFSDAYQGFSQMDNKQLAKLTGLNLEQATRAKQRQYGEPVNWLGNAQLKTEFIGMMRSLGANMLQGGRFLHISGFCDKGKAQHWLAEQYAKETPQQKIISIALGDSENDIAMLEQATIAVLIRSPVHDFPMLKRTLDIYHSRQYGPAGWAECLHEILLSKLIR